MNLRERAAARVARLRSDLDPDVATQASAVVHIDLIEPDGDEAAQAQMEVLSNLEATAAGVYPARWRVDDLRWSLRSLVRAARGQRREGYPWAYVVQADHDGQSDEAIERQAATIRIIVRRVPAQ